MSRGPVHPAVVSPTHPVTVRGSASATAGPAELDREWTAYSDRSTCADWAGGDGVSAFRLSSSQLAWFFSDTYLGPAGPAIGFSRISGFVHNSVVIQTMGGGDSTFVTMTGGGACSRLRGAVSVVGPPAAPGTASDRYWNAAGIEVGGAIIVFYNQYLPGQVPYIPDGTVITRFPVSQLSADDAVAHPAVIALPSYTPPGGGTPVVWGAALLRDRGTVYIYGTQTADLTGGDRLVYVARVAVSRITQFSAWRFYAGPGQWVAGQPNAVPVQGSFGVSSDFSVIAAGQRYWLIQSDPLAGSQDIDAFPGATPWGPFDPSAKVVLYRDTSIGLNAAHDYRIMYDASAEPALSTGNTLVISYNTNSAGVTSGCVPMSAFTNSVTQPRFISVPMAVFSEGRDPVRYRVKAGPTDYPRIVQRDPAQWFDGWIYPSGCPPVPGVTGLRVRTRSGGAVLSWLDAGLGVRYRVYLLRPGAASFALAATTRASGDTLSGLEPGTYLVQVVSVNLKQITGPSAEVAFSLP